MNTCCLIKQKHQMYNECYSTACSLLLQNEYWPEIKAHTDDTEDTEVLLRLLLIMVYCV